MRLKYLNIDPTFNVQSCGDSTLYDSQEYEQANQTRVKICSAITDAATCVSTIVGEENEFDYCTWYVMCICV